MRQLTYAEINAIRGDLTKQEKKRLDHRAGKVGPILSKGKREHVVSKLMDSMRDWRSSPFEREAECRHGLRIGFCLQGFNWARSDAEAGEIVATALNLLGAKRPTWDEGQIEYVTVSRNCAVCWEPLTGATRGQRYCSMACAEKAFTMRGKKSSNYAGAALRSAYRLISKEKAPAQPCQYCGTMFRSDRKGVRFCSATCVSRHTKGETLLADIVCECCGRTCKPAARGSTCCSKTCAGIMKARKERERLSSTVLKCSHCGDDFTPTTGHQVYCSTVCSSTIAKRSWYDRNYKPTPGYERTCLWCGEHFVSKMPWGAVCGRNCKSSIENLSKPVRRPRKMTPQIFDYLVRAAA